MEDKARFQKAFVGKVTILGSAYKVQTYLEIEGYFGVKVTHLGANLCFLEESEEWVIEDLIGEGETWWKQWFSEVRRWNEEDVNNGRLA
ncbi:unnamed protein product [Vicia faba]|uniref:Uncharacterized protein n=1 Tax=Vicia faba TaxID=3906 RepID=A0AAV0ZXE9_VICFA|nr:unnamed protein product [Vicia faba]